MFTTVSVWCEEEGVVLLDAVENEHSLHGKVPRTCSVGSPRDFNPLVFGKGVQYLEEHGIEVIPDFLREACDKLNPIFFRYIGTKMPYTILKYAMTADGKIACAGGASKCISE